MSARAIVFGGYGVFGGHLARELAMRGISVTVAGRDASKAGSAARSLPGGDHRGTAADASDAASSRKAIDGHAVAINAAGPFQSLRPGLLDACLDARVHYIDLADDRRWFSAVRARDPELRARSIAAIPGASSLPGLSGALALLSRSGMPGPATSARVTLFIGNDNPKGEAAIRSALQCAGQPICAPQGILRGFSNPSPVDLPEPFGRRTVRTFESPDYDVLADLVGARAIDVTVGFESRLANGMFGALAAVRLARPLSGLLVAAGRFAPRSGHSGGVVLVELSGRSFGARAAISGATDGQRLAILPAALAAESLLRGTPAAGALFPWELSTVDAYLASIVGAGFTLTR